jgi:hypothetical protein
MCVRVCVSVSRPCLCDVCEYMYSTLCIHTFSSSSFLASSYIKHSFVGWPFIQVVSHRGNIVRCCLWIIKRVYTLSSMKKRGCRSGTSCRIIR